jgi:transketolase
MQLPRPVEMIGIRDVFGESGTPEALMQKYGLNSQSIVEAAIRAISRK